MSPKTGYKYRTCPIHDVKHRVWQGGSIRHDGHAYLLMHCSLGYVWESMILGLEEASELLKAFYLPAMRDLFNKPTGLYDRLYS